MEIETKKEGSVLTIIPKGRIDSSTSGSLDESIKNSLTDEVNELIIEMKDVDFISSKGIRIFLTLHREMSSKGKFILRNINNSVREVLRLSALLNVFNVQ